MAENNFISGTEECTTEKWIPARYGVFLDSDAAEKKILFLVVTLQSHGRCNSDGL